MQRPLRVRRERRGANAVEFAILLPLYLMLVFALVDFGWYMYHLASLHSAVHRGCRGGSLLDSGIAEADLGTVLEQTRELMREAFEEGPGCPASGCSASAERVGERPGKSLRCSLAVDIEPLVGLSVLPGSMSASAVVRLEYQRGE